MTELYLDFTTWGFVVATFVFLGFRLYYLRKPSTDLSEKVYDKLRDKYCSLHIDGKTEHEASELFDIDNVYKTYDISFGLVKSISGMLVGMGILGTFVGLAIGVYNLELGHNGDSISVEDLKPLMNGMKTSFISSIAGMLCSLVYTAFSKTFFSKLQGVIDSYCFDLDRTHFANATFYLRLQMQNQKEASIESISAIKDMRDNLSTDLRNIAVGFNAMSGQIGEQISSSLSEQMKSLSTTFDNIDSTAKTLKATSEHINTLLSVFRSSIDKLNGASDKFDKAFSRSSENFDSLSVALDSVKVVLEEQLPTVVTSIKSSCETQESISNTLKLTTDELNNVISKLPDTNKLSTELAEISKRTQETINKVSNTLDNSVSNISDKLGGLNNIGDNLTHALSDIKTSSETISKTFNDISSSSMAVKAGLEPIVTKLSSSISTMNNAANALSGLSSSLQPTVEAITKSTESMESTTKQQINLLKDQVDNLPEIKDEFQAVVTEFENGISRYTDAVTSNLNTILQSFVASVDKACSAINNTAQSTKESVDGLRNTLDLIEQSKKSNNSNN